MELARIRPAGDDIAKAHGRLQAAGLRPLASVHVRSAAAITMLAAVAATSATKPGAREALLPDAGGFY
jgi:hypothetical protein